ncbi:MAG: YbgA family protein [Candidatus Muiribacteriota bacterium]
MKEKEFVKPRIGISKCLEFDSCRYNGLMISSDTVKMLKKYVQFYPVCPEVEIGLGIPRKPVNVVFNNDRKTLYQFDTKTDLTEKMHDFVEKYSENINNLDGFIFKSASPSCAPADAKVRTPEGKKTQYKTSGTFAGPVIEKLEIIPYENEGRLRNFKLREEFLTRIFTAADFRQNVLNGKKGDLVKFHSKNKYLLMGMSQKYLKILGKIVSTAGKGEFKQKLSDYEENLFKALNKSFSKGNHINVLEHIFGYFKNHLINEEKKLFYDILGNFKNHKLPLSVPVGILRAWLARYPNQYLADQTYIFPFPPELTVISDSGEGRKLN